MVDIAEKLRRRNQTEQETVRKEAETRGEPFLPYVCGMCNMRTALLLQCSICCDEGCGICIPGGDRTPCLTCDAQAEVATPAEFPSELPAGEPDADAEAELDRLYEAERGAPEPAVDESELEGDAD